MKIGLFGGTFNPYHNGHSGIVEDVKSKLRLDSVYLIPSAAPPHKPENNLAPADIRFEMVKKSISDKPGFYVSDKELVRQGPSFTIDTIAEFKNEFDPETQFYLLMGSDAFLDIKTWKAQEKILQTIPIVIMLRGDRDNAKRIANFIDAQLSNKYTYNREQKTFTHPANETITICMVPKIDISSTMIRSRVKRNLSIHGLVPGVVEEMIKSKELYK